jgi:hypothetical protein
MKIDMNVSISKKLWAEISKDVEPPEDGSLSELEQFVMRNCFRNNDKFMWRTDLIEVREEQ